MILVTWWQSALVIFVVGALAVIAVSRFRRSRTNRLPDGRVGRQAHYGSAMAGNGTPPIADPHPTVVEEPFDGRR